MTNTEGHTAKCRRCRRPLHTPASRSAGIGPRCAAIEAALAGLDDRQQDKALECVADGGVIPTGHQGVACVVSEDGESVYLTSVNGNCSCPHGVRHASATAKTCWHPGAVRLAAKPRIRLTAAAFILAA
jgi:hypothetical protein